ncbi:hypothetical protein E2562_000154 [Oryza meyeriana var. granulata]|uniref:Uncharacterized protein n=1 Tax=Oryza meyeriana var. granulata TaxID=110450 RepID=A0A6G1DBN3_9ORYZ|nr:hypothetical protein E2562_000154 [Oryza meyeriana var. granulata]
MDIAKLGKLNVIVDNLSWHDLSTVLLAISTPSFDIPDNFRMMKDTDPAIRALRGRWLVGELAETWELVDELLTFNKHLYMPRNFALLPSILAAIHDNAREVV